ncbi:unnamed protein product [Echinostoma caproni]|uniref:Uncharacterized protein n=1 Tax=Echinostoma caproni TaxID=27848 RepID=A0A183B5V5_9TREM|nr:unnamed protein product [Echinostoma caproni]
MPLSIAADRVLQVLDHFFQGRRIFTSKTLSNLHNAGSEVKVAPSYADLIFTPLTKAAPAAAPQQKQSAALPLRTDSAPLSTTSRQDACNM